MVGLDPQTTPTDPLSLEPLERFYTGLLALHGRKHRLMAVAYISEVRAFFRFLDRRVSIYAREYLLAHILAKDPGLAQGYDLFQWFRQRSPRRLVSRGGRVHDTPVHRSCGGPGEPERADQAPRIRPNATRSPPCPRPPGLMPIRGPRCLRQTRPSVPTNGTLLNTEIQVDGTAISDPVEQSLDLRGRGQIGPCLPATREHIPGLEPAADRAEGLRPARRGPQALRRGITRPAVLQFAPARPMLRSAHRGQSTVPCQLSDQPRPASHWRRSAGRTSGANRR